MEPTAEPAQDCCPLTSEKELLHSLLNSSPPLTQLEVQHVIEEVTINAVEELDDKERQKLLEIIDEVRTCHLT